MMDCPRLVQQRPLGSALAPRLSHPFSFVSCFSIAFRTALLGERSAWHCAICSCRLLHFLFNKERLPCIQHLEKRTG